MAIDLLNHKLDRAFDHIDAGGKGVVEREDLLGLGARILVGFGESPTSVTGSSLVDSFDGIWRRCPARSATTRTSACRVRTSARR